MLPQIWNLQKIDKSDNTIEMYKSVHHNNVIIAAWRHSDIIKVFIDETTIAIFKVKLKNK